MLTLITRFDIYSLVLILSKKHIPKPISTRVATNILFSDDISKINKKAVKIGISKKEILIERMCVLGPIKICYVQFRTRWKENFNQTYILALNLYVPLEKLSKKNVRLEHTHQIHEQSLLFSLHFILWFFFVIWKFRLIGSTYTGVDILYFRKFL